MLAVNLLWLFWALTWAPHATPYNSARLVTHKLLTRSRKKFFDIFAVVAKPEKNSFPTLELHCTHLKMMKSCPVEECTFSCEHSILKPCCNVNQKLPQQQMISNQTVVNSNPGIGTQESNTQKNFLSHRFSPYPQVPLHKSQSMEWINNNKKTTTTPQDSSTSSSSKPIPQAGSGSGKIPKKESFSFKKSKTKASASSSSSVKTYCDIKGIVECYRDNPEGKTRKSLMSIMVCAHSFFSGFLNFFCWYLKNRISQRRDWDRWWTSCKD